jgi:hypothetical protein
VYQLTEFDEAAASNVFYCFRLHDHFEPAFLLGFFENNGHGRQLTRHITTGARSNGLLNMDRHESGGRWQARSKEYQRSAEDSNARAYFCVGYGFNDEHVQTKLIEHCDRDSTPLVVITKELTPTAKSFLTGGRCRRYLAIEDGPAGARAYMHDAPAGFDLDQPLWRLDQFLDHITGTPA